MSILGDCPCAECDKIGPGCKCQKFVEWVKLANAEQAAEVARYFAEYKWPPLHVTYVSKNP